MDRAFELPRAEPLRGNARASVSEPRNGEGTEPDLDLDRLVWDPEYREAMRPLLKRAG